MTPGVSSAARLALALLPALCLGCSEGCSADSSSDPREPPGATPPAVSAPPAAGQLAAPPTIVLITIDTLRREHLGCYGYFRPTSPRIDALAREGLVFERALASMASTLPSHLTMLTGLYPHQHGMNSNRRGASVSFTSELGRLSAADVLRRNGYRTAAFVSAAPLAATTGVGVGFETFAAPEDSGAGVSLRAGERNEAVLAWLEENAPKPGPFFLWVHYFDPHEPSDPVAPYDARFTTDAEQLAWIQGRGIEPAELTERFGRSFRVQRHFLGLAGSVPPRQAQEQDVPNVAITLERIADLMNRYDGELAYTDEHVGHLLDALRRLGRYDEAIVALVADHGQSLGEDRWIGHGTITDVNTFVPLILRLPQGLLPPQRLGALVSLTDLMPTLLARFELPGSELLQAQFEGEDVLSGHFTRDTALAARTADALKDGESGRQFALHSGSWKYIHRPGGKDELYDLSGAGEFVDVLPAQAEIGARLRTATLELLARRPALLEDEPASGSEDPDLIRSLEALGYGGEDGD